MLFQAMLKFVLSRDALVGQSSQSAVIHTRYETDRSSVIAPRPCVSPKFNPRATFPPGRLVLIHPPSASRRPAPSSSPRRPSAFGASKDSSAARSRTAIPAPSSTGPSPCSSREWRKRSSEQPRSHVPLRLSVPGRINTDLICLHPAFPRPSSASRGSTTAANAPMLLPAAGDVLRARSWSSTTCRRVRNRARPAPTTSV